MIFGRSVCESEGLSVTGRECLLRLLEGGLPERLPFMPITMMFAADHIGKSYGEYASDYRVLVEGQLAVSEAYGADYVSCISDPGREAADCGARIKFFDDQPPAIVESEALLSDKKLLAELEIPDPLGEGRMLDRVRAARRFRETAGAEKLVEGWIEGPCAEAADLRGINTLMTDFFDDGAFVRELFEFTLQMGLRFGQAQADAGVDLMGVGDAAVSLVGPKIYREFVWPYEKRLVDGLHEMGLKVRLHICGNTTPILAAMGELECDIVDLDFMVSMEAARQAMGPDQVLLGNIDPVRALRDGTPESIEAAIAECHRQAGPRYIVGAGCEVPRSTPAENLLAMSRYAHAHAP